MKKSLLFSRIAGLSLLLGSALATHAQTAGIVDGGTYKLTHHGVVDPTTGTALCLDVDFDSNQPGASIGQYLDNGLDAQRFILELQSDGSYKVRHKNTQLYVQPVALSTAAFTQMEQNVSVNDDAQRWIITNTGADGYKFILKATATAALPQALEIGYASNVPGARVNLFDDNGFVPAQRWDLTLMATPTATKNAVNPSFSVEAYPNPFGQRLNVRIYTATAGPAQLELHDMLGRSVRHLNTVLHAGSNEVLLPGDNVPAAGVYILRLRQGEAVQQLQVVQQ
jgi:hypothetical protein